MENAGIWGRRTKTKMMMGSLQNFSAGVFQIVFSGNLTLTLVIVAGEKNNWSGHERKCDSIQFGGVCERGPFKVSGREREEKEEEGILEARNCYG